MPINKPAVVALGRAVDSNLCPAINLQEAQDQGSHSLANQPAGEIESAILEFKSRVRELVSTLAG